ncbi:hypothetical protein [Streptomyces asiaticus]
MGAWQATQSGKQGQGHSEVEGLLNGQTRTWTYTRNPEDRLTDATTPDGEHTTWDYAPDTHRPLTPTDYTSLVREPGESLIGKFTGADDDTAHRFHAIIKDLVGTPTELITR